MPQNGAVHTIRKVGLTTRGGDVARTERTDYQATSDPALQASADRGEAQLLSYRDLYRLWERQHWAVQDLDFTQDRIDWQERIDPDERLQRMYGLSSFFVGEQRVALESDSLEGRLAETSEHLNPEFGTLFDELLAARVDRLAREPEDLGALVEAVTIYHMVIEGMLALTGQHFIMDFNERMGTLPGFVAGFTLVARDEHRHVAFGARFLRDMARRDPRHGDAIQRTLAEVAPAADGVLKPKWFDGTEDEPTLFGVSVAETRAFAMKALERRLKGIGLLATAQCRRERGGNWRPR